MTVTGTDANNVLTDKTVIARPARDKARVTIERDINGDGIVDQRQQVTTANTGVQTSVITDLKADGTLADKTTTTVSADGRQTTILWDFDGNGTNDRQRIVNDAIRADGGRTTVSTDTDLVTNKVAAVDDDRVVFRRPDDDHDKGRQWRQYGRPDRDGDEGPLRQHQERR